MRYISIYLIALIIFCPVSGVRSQSLMSLVNGPLPGFTSRPPVGNWAVRSQMVYGQSSSYYDNDGAVVSYRGPVETIGMLTTSIEKSVNEILALGMTVPLVLYHSFLEDGEPQSSLDAPGGYGKNGLGDILLEVAFLAQTSTSHRVVALGSMKTTTGTHEGELDDDEAFPTGTGQFDLSAGAATDLQLGTATLLSAGIIYTLGLRGEIEGYDWSYTYDPGNTLVLAAQLSHRFSSRLAAGVLLNLVTKELGSISDDCESESGKGTSFVVAPKLGYQLINGKRPTYMNVGLSFQLLGAQEAKVNLLMAEIHKYF
ncbi:MAG: hypothetical protein ACETWG_11105 [Candidatus Neomarinimicrobiota bacterium]